MLRPLLLLCWAATIVSAGVRENANGTSVHTNLAGDSVAANAQTTPIIHPLPAGQDAHAPAEPKVEPQPNLPSNGGEHTTSDSTEEPNVITPPTKPPTISTKATTSRSVTLTTTTSKPVTTPTPTSTTVAPTTTPTPVPTTPLPPPSTGRWKVWKGNTTLCILVQMAAQFNVSYTNAENVTIHKAMDIPDNGTVTGNCGEIEQNLTVSWGSQNKSQDNFTLHFMKNETEKHYSLHHFEISLAAKEFPNDKLNKTVTLVHVAPQFTTGLSNSYRCIKEQQLNLTLKGSNVTVGLLKVTNLQFQAFRGDNTTNFGLAKDCSFDTPDIVPITVGCALAGLVVIVLIAYLVGRRRSQARGYLSM